MCRKQIIIFLEKKNDYHKLTSANLCYLNKELADSFIINNYFNQNHDSTELSAMFLLSNEKLISDNIVSQVISESQSCQIKTCLVIFSIIFYFNDCILTSKMMCIMIILYIDSYNHFNFSSDFLLLLLLASEALLAQFSKTYFLIEEQNSLVDDTVIFADRIRQTKFHQFCKQQELDFQKLKLKFNKKTHVEIILISEISHEFLHFVFLFFES